MWGIAVQIFRKCTILLGNRNGERVLKQMLCIKRRQTNSFSQRNMIQSRWKCIRPDARYTSLYRVRRHPKVLGIGAEQFLHIGNNDGFPTELMKIDCLLGQKRMLRRQNCPDSMLSGQKTLLLRKVFKQARRKEQITASYRHPVIASRVHLGFQHNLWMFLSKLAQKSSYMPGIGIFQAHSYGDCPLQCLFSRMQALHNRIHPIQKGYPVLCQYTTGIC